MWAVGVIALNTFRESLRDKILYNLLVFALLLIGASVLLADLSIMEHHRIITNMGLAAINLVGVMIAIFVGISLVNKEIERRTVYTIMARPISRAQFILGKYGGLSVTLAVNVAIMLFVFLGTLWAYRAPIRFAFVQAVELIFVELLVVTAIALFFSTFSSSTLSAILTIGLTVIGHLTADLKGLAEKSHHETLQTVVTALYYLCPNLEALNVKDLAATGAVIEPSYQAIATFYGVLYATLFLTGACVVFKQRNF
jgi:ABC-type transport system involved in multi-copper enzyme maturation permease subunit